MTGMLANVIVIALLVLIVGSAVLYIRKEKKKRVFIVLDVHLQDPVPAHVCPIRKSMQKNDHAVKV